MEALEFRLAASTAQNFLDRYLAVAGITIANEPDIVHHAHVCFYFSSISSNLFIFDQYLAELSLPASSMVKYLPSEIAASCVVLSLHTYGHNPYVRFSLFNFLTLTLAATRA